MAQPADHSCVALWRTLFRASCLLEERVRRAVGAHGLGVSDFGVLETLLEHGTLAVNDLGQRLSLTSGSITTAVDRLARRGLVARHPSAKDARSRMVELRPKGRALIDSALEAHARAATEGLAPLNNREREQALALLTKLINGATKA